MNTTYTLSFKTTTQPDFGGFKFYVEAGKLFDADDYADAYKLNRSDIDAQDIHSAQDAAGRLTEGEWLEVTHVGANIMSTQHTPAAEAIEAKFGTVEHEGKTLTLTQQAYCDNVGAGDQVAYFARAVDAEGNVYKVKWDTTFDWDEAEAAFKADPLNAPPNEDESLACDWDNPAAIVRVD